MSTANRRHHERFPFSSRLEVRRQGAASDALPDSATVAAPAIALDVSVGGFGFRSLLPLRVGDLISVTLPEMMGREADHEAEARQREESLPTIDVWLEIVAVVRHVSRDADNYVIGAERHTAHA